MKRISYSESQIIGILKEAESGMPIPELCRKHGMGNSTFYKWRGKPKEIRCDNGPEYISTKLQRWAETQKVKLIYTQSGNPQQNAYIERFNRTVRYDWLNQDIFTDIEEVQDKSTGWRLWHYNHERPNMALGGVTPYQKRMMLNQVENSTQNYS